MGRASRWHCVIGALLSASAATPTYAGISCQPAMTQLQQRVWTTDNGLSLDMVKDVEVSSGMLWVATEEGLDIFDGLRMQNIDFSRQGASPFFEDLVPHPDTKQVFAASYYHGILLIDADGAWSVLPDSPRATKALAISPEGLLVAGKRKGGVQVLPLNDMTRADWQSLDGILSHGVTALHPRHEGGVWIGYESGHIQWWHDGDVGTVSTVPHGETDRIESLYHSQSGQLWAGTQQGLLRIRAGGVERFKLADAPTVVTDINEGPAGALWFATATRGVGRICDGRPELFGAGDGLFSNHIKRLTTGPDQSLWLASAGDGIARLHRGPITPFTPKEGLPAAPILPVLSTPAGDIWMGTYGAGLVKLDERRGDVTKIDEGINHTVLSLASDADGAIWAGTRQGLARIQDHRVVDVFGVEDGLPNLTVSSLYADGSKLWIGTEGGLAVLDNGSIRSIDDRGLIVDSIYTLFVGRTGTLWVGTNSGGVLRLVDDQLQRAPFDESTHLAAIFDFHEDNEGRLWIGTSHGLWRWASGSLQMISERDGLYEPSVFSVTQDAAGNLWTSGNHGIYQLEMSQVEAFLADKTASISVRRFTDRDGMPRAETNAGFQPTVSVTPAGELLYPTSSGLAVVDPAQLATRPDPPVTRIIDARLDEKIQVPQQGHIDPFPGIVQFQFSAIEYSNPHRVQFSYRLSGLDPQWRVTTNHNASFHQLPAGWYSFEVRARHGEGPWSAAAKHEFFVERHWSRHPAVAGSVGIALILLGWYGARRFLQSRALHRQRLQDTQKLEALGWMASGIAHDFNNVLGTIVLAAEDIRANQTADSSTRDDASYIVEAANTGKALSSELTRYATSKPEPDEAIDLAGELSATTAFLSRLVSRAIRVETEIPSTLGHCRIGPIYLRQVMMNLVVNANQAMAHTGTLRVSARLDQSGPDAWAIIEVSDTGHGMDAKTLKRIFDPFYTTKSTGSGLGLMVTREIVESVGGSIKVTSTVGSGTCFSLRLPVTLDQGSEHSGAPLR